MDMREALKKFIETEIAVGTTVAYDDDLLMTGLVNSLDVIRLVTFTQEQFGVTVPPEDVVIEHFQTIDAIANYLQTRVEA
ncbi:MAG: acyl carrier protein [Chloroflexota bacterium]